MKFRSSLLLVAVTLALPAFRAAAQTKPDSSIAQEKQSKPQPGWKPMFRNDRGLEAALEGPEFLRRRQDWFFKPRAFPIGFIPQGARERALERTHQMLQNEGRLNLRLAPGSGFVQPGPTTSAWQSIGPQATSSISNAPFTSGRVTAIVVNPNNASNAYLGGADGGLWVTTDAGTTWTPLTDFPPSAGIASVAVGSLAVDPSACTTGAAGICTTVYVGTGEDNFAGDNIYGEGVLKCTVAAGSPPTASCTQDNTFHTPSPLDDTRGGPMIGALAINPKTSGSAAILLAGVRGRSTALKSGIYCSSDGGSTWTAVFGISGIVGTDTVFASDGTAFVALGFPLGNATNNGIYKSSVAVSSCTAVTDANGTTPGGTGSKWIKQTLPTGTPASGLGRIALAILPSTTSTAGNATLYAAIADSTTSSANLLGVIRTTNGGTSWTQLSATPGFCNSQCFYDLAIAVDPIDSTGNTVFAGGSAQSTLMRTTNGGTSWTEVSRASDANGDGLHVDTHALAFSKDGGVLYVGNDGGVWSSAFVPTAGIPNWNNLNAKLSITQFYPGTSIHPSTPLSGLGGTQDNDVQQYQGPSLVWQSQEIGCDGGFTAIDPAIPSTIYGECEYLPGTQFFPIIEVAFNGQQLGNGFLANSGIDNTDRGSFIPPLVMDLKNPRTLYFGTCRVWQTKDGANTWNALSPDVTTATHPAGCVGGGATLSSIAVSPSNSNTVYTGADNGEIEVTADGGVTWTSVTTATLPARSITQVAVDPTGTAYVAFSGFGSCATFCDGKGHLFKTVNGTNLWTEIDGAGPTKLPDIPVNAIVIDPDDPTHNTFYVGTDIGAFFTTSGGATWSVLGTTGSLPPAEILSLTLHEPSRTLRAATHGRGVWDLNLGGQASFGITSISPLTASAGAASISNFTVNGNGFTASSVVKFTANGTTTSLMTSCSNANTCTAIISAAQLQNGALAQVTVTDPGQTNPTNAVPFTVLNPVPGITSISPTFTTAGTNGLSLTVNGSNFLSGATGTLVLLNTIPLPANAVTVQSSTVLTVQVPPSNLTTVQVVTVDTFNRQPGGGPDTNPTPPTLAINNPVPSITSLSPPSATAGGAAFTLTVNGTGFNASSGVSFNGIAKTPTIVSSAQLTIPIAASDVATAGTVLVQVTNPSPGGGSASMNFTVSASGSFTVQGTPVTITATAGQQTNTGMSTITTIPGGSNGPVSVTCPTAPPGVTCSALTIPSGSTSGTLTVNLMPPSTTLTASAPPLQRTLYTVGIIPPGSGQGWWALSAGTGLAAIILLLPGRKRYRAALGLGLVCVLSFTLGCGGYGGGGGGGGGPVATTTKITVNQSKVQFGPNNTFAFTVNVTASVGANGQVQLFDRTSTLGSPVTAYNGSATINSSGLAVGTHAISAHYLGDANTQASQSGTLNVTVTGLTTFVISTTPAASNGTPTVNLTIN